MTTTQSPPKPPSPSTQRGPVRTTNSPPCACGLGHFHNPDVCPNPATEQVQVEGERVHVCANCAKVLRMQAREKE